MTTRSWAPRRLNKLHQPGNSPGDDASLQREQLANTFLRALGVPWLYRRYVAVYVNGNRRGALMEDGQTPNSDVVKEQFPERHRRLALQDAALVRIRPAADQQLLRLH